MSWVGLASAKEDGQKAVWAGGREAERNKTEGGLGGLGGRAERKKTEGGLGGLGGRAGGFRDRV